MNTIINYFCESLARRKGKVSPTKGDHPAGNTEKPLVDADIYSEIEPKVSCGVTTKCYLHSS